MACNKPWRPWGIGGSATAGAGVGGPAAQPAVERCIRDWTLWSGKYLSSPGLFSENTDYFNDGADFPPGTYGILYYAGAMMYNSSLGVWQVNWDTDGNGFLVVWDNGDSEAAAPGSTNQYDTQAEVEAANAGLRKTITHVGGKIGIRFVDTPYNDNVAGNPSPTYMLIPV